MTAADFRAGSLPAAYGLYAATLSLPAVGTASAWPQVPQHGFGDADADEVVETFDGAAQDGTIVVVDDYVAEPSAPPAHAVYQAAPPNITALLKEASVAPAPATALYPDLDEPVILTPEQQYEYTFSTRPIPQIAEYMAGDELPTCIYNVGTPMGEFTQGLQEGNLQLNGFLPWQPNGNHPIHCTLRAITELFISTSQYQDWNARCANAEQLVQMILACSGNHVIGLGARVHLASALLNAFLEQSRQIGTSMSQQQFATSFLQASPSLASLVTAEGHFHPPFHSMAQFMCEPFFKVVFEKEITETQLSQDPDQALAIVQAIITRQLAVLPANISAELQLYLETTIYLQWQNRLIQQLLGQSQTQFQQNGAIGPQLEAQIANIHRFFCTKPEMRGLVGDLQMAYQHFFHRLFAMNSGQTYHDVRAKITADAQIARSALPPAAPVAAPVATLPAEKNSRWRFWEKHSSEQPKPLEEDPNVQALAAIAAKETAQLAVVDLASRLSTQPLYPVLPPPSTLSADDGRMHAKPAPSAPLELIPDGMPATPDATSSSRWAWLNPLNLLGKEPAASPAPAAANTAPAAASAATEGLPAATSAPTPYVDAGQPLRLSAYAQFLMMSGARASSYGVSSAAPAAEAEPAALAPTTITVTDAAPAQVPVTVSTASVSMAAPAPAPAPYDPQALARYAKVLELTGARPEPTYVVPAAQATPASALQHRITSQTAGMHKSSYLTQAFPQLVGANLSGEVLFSSLPMVNRYDVLRHLHTSAVKDPHLPIETLIGHTYDFSILRIGQAMAQNRTAAMAHVSRHCTDAETRKRGEAILDSYYNGNRLEDAFWVKLEADLAAFPRDAMFNAMMKDQAEASGVKDLSVLQSRQHRAFALALLIQVLERYMHT